MSLMEDLRLGEVTDANAIDESMAAGYLPAEGYHHAYLDGYRPFDTNSGASGHEFTFKILGGPWDGKEVKGSVFKPKGEDPEKDEKARNKLRLFAHRLGLLKKVKKDGKDVYEAVEGKSEFMHAIGTEVIINVKHEDFEGQKGKGKKAVLEYEGILPLDDKRAKDVKRGRKPGTANTPATAAAKQPQQQQFAGI